MLVSDSEHLETHLVAVPTNSVKDFTKTYETLSPMVVPRSAYWITKDDEYALYAVTTFKKHSSEFVHKCREKKWTPRDFKFKEGGREEEQNDIKKTDAEERRVWGETLRLGRTGWSEGVMCLVHIIVIRCFVESVLRYGLPPDFVTALIKVSLLSQNLGNTARECYILIILSPTRRKHKKQNKVWIRSSVTLQATRSEEIRRAG